MNEALLAMGEHPIPELWRILEGREEYHSCDNLHQEVQDALRQVEKINFDGVIDKITSPEELGGKAWSEEKVLENIKWYKRMLVIAKVFGFDEVSPVSEDIDEIWHTHILHTVQYAKDCQMFFGTFFHHNPCGQKAHETLGETLRKARLKTLERYETVFGEAPVMARAMCCSNGCLCSKG